MARLIIDYDASDISTADAMAYVSSVVSGGRVSERTINGVEAPHFCWVTSFLRPDTTRLYVHTRRKRTGDSADSFLLLIGPAEPEAA